MKTNHTFKFLGLLMLVLSFATTSCVSKKKFTAMEAQYESAQMALKSQLDDCNTKNKDISNQLAAREADVAGLRGDLNARDGQLRLVEDQLAFMKSTNTNLLNRLEDLSVINKSGAESIRKSLEALNDQSKYIQDLSSQIQRKDSINLALVMNLKRSLSDINDEDVQIEVKKGVVYISLSDKMLFRSGSATIQPAAETVLGKVAKVLNDHRDLDILIEGHTDNVPIRTDCVKDNWDLSVMRATSVARSLQTKYSVDPSRMIAGGSSEYKPKADNNQITGRNINRRTEIIITPKLDQFFELLSPE
jgi:chemotaxis protein MotB